MSWSKNLNMTPKDVIWNISYENLIMLGAATPQYDDEKEAEWDSSKDASEPGNFAINENEEEEYVR